MPRKKRQLADNAIYHIYNRGNDRRSLFRAHEDYLFFLQLLKAKKGKYPADIFHYCLMTNHYHLLVRIKVAEQLSQLMHELQLGYARYFKDKYRLFGHIFQERYRSPLIPQESYYLQCGRYIERNPVEAGMVEQAWDYSYSSSRYYALGVEDDLIMPNFYYEGMGKTAEERMRAYKDFVSLQEPYSGMIGRELARV